MANDLPGSYCQNCLSWNPGDRETCVKCGTRLLILAGDQTWEDEPDEPEGGEDLEEHLLERITGLEETLRRVETYLETVSDQLGKLERSEVMLRTLLRRDASPLSREVWTKLGPQFSGAVKALTANGLFRGQSPAFFAVLQDLAVADAARQHAVVAVAVVGEPGRDYFWILSREPRLDEALFNQIVERAKQQGYQLEKLMRASPPS